MTKCLLVKTADKRKFLVHEKNMSSIVEYVKTFHAEIYRVEVIEGKVISHLKNLAGAICNPDYKPKIKIKNPKKIYPKSRARMAILSNAKKIRTFIQSQLNKGKPVSLKELKLRYQNCNITDACLCNHLSAVRKQLALNGMIIKKIGQGKYCLIT